MMKLWLIIFDILSNVSNGFAIVSAPNPSTAQLTLMMLGSGNLKGYNITGIQEVGTSCFHLIRILTEGITSRGEQGIQGLKGDRGELGPIGPLGPKGNDGYTPLKGIDYFDGELGPQGLIGPTGPLGLQGETGLQGPKGEQGELGIKGDLGEQGIQGIQGPLGIQGVKGDKGDTGDVGPQGPLGEIGPQGPQGELGILGLLGEKGDPFSIYKTYESIALMNEDLANVPEGKFTLIASNVEDPDNAKLFIRTEDSFKFLTDMSGALGIQGPMGPLGILGPQGIQGIQGETGPLGEVGPKGDTGERGPLGEQGILGELGIQGPKGDTGEKGETGALGPIGETGPQGPTGAKGDKGDTYTITLDDYTVIALIVENEITVPTKVSELENDAGYLTLHLDISGKLDVISDLEAIRSGAALGGTALLSYTETDPTVPLYIKDATTASNLASTIAGVNGFLALTRKTLTAASLHSGVTTKHEDGIYSISGTDPNTLLNDVGACIIISFSSTASACIRVGRNCKKIGFQIYDGGSWGSIIQLN